MWFISKHNGVWHQLVIAHYLISLEDERINGANLKFNPISFDVLHSLLLIVILAKKKNYKNNSIFWHADKFSSPLPHKQHHPTYQQNNDIFWLILPNLWWTVSNLFIIFSNNKQSWLETLEIGYHHQEKKGVYVLYLVFCKEGSILVCRGFSSVTNSL